MSVFGRLLAVSIRQNRQFFTNTGIPFNTAALQILNP